MSERITIRKYPNRRLYHVGEARYVNLDEIERLVLDDVDFRVVESATGEDITRRVLVQVMFEHLAEYDPVFPEEFIRFTIKQRGAVSGWNDLMKRFLGAEVLGPFAGMFGLDRKRDDGEKAPEEEEDPLRREVEALRRKVDGLERQFGGDRKRKGR